MPLYYFHLRGPAGRDADEIGLEYANLEEAYLEACWTIPSMAADFVRQGRNPLEYAFEIADADGSLLMEVAFGERLPDANKPRRPASSRPWTGVQGAVERAEQLVTSIHEQVEALHNAMRSSQRLLNDLGRPQPPR